MKNSGIIKYEGYNGTKGKGLKNKRTKKREVIRRREAEARREIERIKKAKSYSKKKSYNSFYDDDD